MTRGELFDTVFNAVYETAFGLIDKEPYDGDDDGIDWQEDVTDSCISVDVSIKINPNRAANGKKCKVRRIV